MEQKAWWQMKREEVISELHSSTVSGLENEEARHRLERGSNQLESDDGLNPLILFLNQFVDTMVLVLLGATVISAVVGSIADAVTILAIVIINAVLGFVQEYRAEKSLEEIQKLTTPSAQVLRGGKRFKIAAAELVPGDIVYLESGSRIPADVRILESFSLEVDESSLTGESVPVMKQADSIDDYQVPLAEQSNLAFMGTIVTRGRAGAIVISTGMNTIMGQIVSIIKENEAGLTPLQQRLDRLGKVLIVICLTVCAAVTIMGIYRGEPLLTMFMAGISLAVAAIPEGLPAIVTVVLALGVQRMARRNAIIRKLPAVETLGCTTVICSDKTGTLTQNKMSVIQLATLNRMLEIENDGYEPLGRFLQSGREFSIGGDPAASLLAETAFNCNNARLERRKGAYYLDGDPTEGALLAMAGKAGLSEPYKRLGELPFDSERKRMSVLVVKNDRTWLMTKGAMEVLLPLCSSVFSEKGMVPLNTEVVQHFLSIQDLWASQGKRVLAFAARVVSNQEASEMKESELESGLCLLGITALLDPPRPGVDNAIRECQAAGIIPVMITGDHPGTARAIARQIGLASGEEVVTGSDMEHLSDEELYKKTTGVRVFARVTPQHKNRIVKVLKRREEVAAMTGDGVNDAPALKAADIGIAMGISGTEVAKEASAMVLADDDFSTIVRAVYEGRAIYDNIRKFIRYLLGCNIGEVLVMFFASLLGMPLPLLPIQILWVNLVTDGLPAAALGLEPPEPGIMNRPPRPRSEGIFARGLGYKVLGRGLYISIVTLTAFLAGIIYTRLNGSPDLGVARSMALTTLVMGQLFYVFECRSEQYSPFQLGFFKNRFLLIAVLCSLVMQTAVLFLPFMQNIFHTTALNYWQLILVIMLAGPRFIVSFILYTLQRISVSRNDYAKINA